MAVKSKPEAKKIPAKPVEKSTKTNKQELEKLDVALEEIPSQDNLDLEDQTQVVADKEPREELVVVPAPAKAVKLVKKHHHHKKSVQKTVKKAEV